jgi:alanine dehydrogenase
MLHLSREDIKSLLSYEEVVRAVEEGMRKESAGEAHTSTRIDMPLGPGRPGGFNIGSGKTGMSIWIGGSDDRGGTIRALTGGGAIALYIDETGTPAAIMDFAHMQQYRTGAVAAIGTRLLARPDSHTFAMLGTGWFARATLAAHAVTMNMRDVRVYSRSKENREQFASDLQREIDIEVRPEESVDAAVEGADVILVCTGMNGRADPPAIRGDMLRPGVHVTANGGANEVDISVYECAARVVVDDKPEMKQQILDIQKAVEMGVLAWDTLEELPDLVASDAEQRRLPDDITVLRTRGNGVQDLFPTVDLYHRALERGVGTELGTLTRPRYPE